MVRFGDHEFDWSSYDAASDVLYLSKGEPSEARDSLASPEGHAVRLDAEGEIIGLTLVNARWIIDNEGAITITLPERITAPSEEIEAALTG